METIKKSEMLQRAETIEEECNHFLRTYVSELSREQATRRCAAIIAQFERLLLVGHEHCTHPMNVQLAVIPVDRLKLEVPEKMKGQLVVRIFVDTKEGFLMMVTGKEVVPGVAIGIP